MVLPASWRLPWRHPWVRHLRLPFNLLLSPLYLWGVLLAGGGLRSLDVWLGYLALHVFLYGGTNAFNSYYDRDEGPIGGMLEPPPVDPGLLPFSLAWQAAGLPLAWLVNPPFALAWALLFLVLAAYSHPAVRFKRDPAAALLAVALGQGGIGFAAGWLAARPEPPSLLGAPALWGMLTTALILAGLYVVTQSYQTVEDRARGDRTLPVLWGPRTALRAAAAALALGGALMLAFVAARFGVPWAAALGAHLVPLGAWLWRWSGRFDEADAQGEFRRTMRFAALASGGLTLFLLARLAIAGG